MSMPSRFWNNAKFRAVFYQVLVLTLILYAILWFAFNAQQALQVRGITTGFSFLTQASGFALSDGIVAHTPVDSYWHALMVGGLNTVTVSISAIVGASIIGLIVGVARLSNNRLLSGLAVTYVELFRNTPQLLQLVMWYLLLTLLPAPRAAIQVIDGHVLLTNRGLSLPSLASGTSLFLVIGIALLLMGVATFLSLRLLDWFQRRVGRTVSPVLPLLCAALAALVLTWLLVGAPTALQSPTLQGFKYRGGQNISPEFLALFFGLSLYIGAFIAEIVRAGLQSVPHAQIEAADSIPLRRLDRFRLIILPQALRVMVPPGAAQYVSLLKNSSLGVAVGYPELFNVTNTSTTLSGQALECISVMAAFYLSIALCISFAMNQYNRYVQIQER